MIKDLIRKNRSYRRFNENERIPQELLKDWVNLARLSASSRNQQALKFKLFYDLKECEKMFSCLSWAGYLSDWTGAAPGERPAAYIMILGDMQLGTNFDTDLGIAAQSIMLGAVEAGYGGCMIASVNRDRARDIFALKDIFEILLVLALGKPAEKVVIEPMKEGNIEYWRDSKGIHHVPKRALNELIV